jgi:hypothetical protein
MSVHPRPAMIAHQKPREAGVEQDEHSGHEQGGGEHTGGSAPDAGEGVGPEATGPEQQSLQADAIMSRLPRTRPQRVTGRRRREPAPGEATAVVSTARAPKRAAARTKSRAPATTGPAAGPKKAPAAARATAPAGSRAPRRRTAPPAAMPAARRPGTPTPVTGGAASLPRLAVDGAVEAAKLPLKVGGRLTLRALEAVARSLRND